MVNADWKKQNYNSKIRVSEQTIQKLRNGKTFENNIAIAKNAGKIDAQTREGMNRFYGKSRVSSALGNSLSSTAVGKTKPPTAEHNTSGNTPPKGNKTTTKTAPIVKPRKNNFLGLAGGFIKNELLGVDDFSKTRQQFNNRDFKSMGKSYLAGGLEVGTTIGTLLATPFTGGGSAAAVFGAKATAFAARQVAKEAVKTTAKNTIKKVSLKAAAKAAGSGSVKAGAKKVVVGAGKTAIKIVRPVKTTKAFIGSTVNKAGLAVTKQAIKNAGASSARTAVKEASSVSAKAAADSAAARIANEAAKDALARMITKGAKGGALRGAKNRVAKAGVKAKSARNAALSAKNKSGAANTALNKQITAAAAKRAAAAKGKKTLGKVAKRAQIAHYGANRITKSNNGKGK
jgi:hypothetical protein